MYHGTQAQNHLYIRACSIKLRAAGTTATHVNQVSWFAGRYILSLVFVTRLDIPYRNERCSRSAPVQYV